MIADNIMEFTDKNSFVYSWSGNLLELTAQIDEDLAKS